MKYKYSVITALEKSLKELMNAGEKIPIRSCLNINRDIDKVQSALVPYYKTRDKIISDYSNGTGTVNQGDENWDACVKDITELDNEEIEIDLEKVNLTDLDKISLSLSTVRGLTPIINDEKDGDGNG